MLEAGYQKKIMSGIEKIGGHVVNGKYTRDGEADLQCGYPVETMMGNCITLHHLCVEVKTKEAYETLMKKMTMVIVDGVEQYKLDSSFKGREILQAAKINKVRRLGGLALFAYSFEQVQQYVKDNT